jgi:hypothetical protein
MQMIFSRTISFLDDQTLAPGNAREALFRDEHCGFILYLSDDLAEPKDRVIRLGAREALLWLNRISQGDELSCGQDVWAQLPQTFEHNEAFRT